MPDKKLTDSEIIKALTICAENDKCWLCPIQKKCKGFPNLHKDALDLINRLQAENDNICKKSKAEIINIIAEQQIAKQEVDRLSVLVIELQKQLKTTKAEAYKEFAKRLKRRFLNKNEIINNTIDNLLKELVSETNV